MNEGRERGRESGGKGGTEEGRRGERRERGREGKWLKLQKIMIPCRIRDFY